MTDLKWWQKAVFYQIYPRSFADGNGDGVGDFPGMTEKLDFLQDLGIDAVWLSPHYPSPLADCGYDISDYTAVAPEYGTLGDFQRFLDEAHDRSIRVILDLVLNHTSDQHGWFLESRASRDNPKRDWYIWRDGKNGGPPNNWESGFGGSAWELDPATGQYYYHYFLKEQPDLNWRNPEVKRAMWDVVRFWLDMGVDGFRLDAISTIYERADLPDHAGPRTLVELQAAREVAAGPLEADPQVLADWNKLYEHQIDQPGIHKLMQELRAVLNEYEGHRVLVGESEDVCFHGEGDELDLVFNFPLMKPQALTPAHIRKNQRERLAALAAQCHNAWPCNTLGNHDSSRVKTRFGDGVHDDALARLHAALLLTLQGTPFLYNGEEIGMTDYPLPEIGQFRDLWGIWNYRAAVEKLHLPPEVALARANEAGRDKNRTPYQWAHAANGGFSPAGVTTWLPVNPNWAEGVNAADQAAEPGSLLNFYRDLLRVRQNTSALIEGEFAAVHEEAEEYLAFLRRRIGGHRLATNESTDVRRTAPAEAKERMAVHQTCLVVLNFSERPLVVDLSEVGQTASVLFASGAGAGWVGGLANLTVEPFGVFVGEVL